MLSNWIKGVCILLISMCSTGLSAQTGNSPYGIKGTLADSITHEKEPYATIRIFSVQTPNKLIKASVTDDNGEFHISLNQPGRYIINLSSIGKLMVERRFDISKQHPYFNLGTVYTAESSEMLKGVEIVAQKPLVKAEIDKIAYNIEDDPDSDTNTALEMLRKVPLVTVDGDDNIQVNGSSNFKVHVNGKPNSLMSSNPKEVLQSMPANTIKSIEVITEPGAKYDAEGIGGILNIITVGHQMEGYNITLGTKVSNTGINGYGYGTVQIGKFTLTGNYTYAHIDAPKKTTENGREDFTSETNKFLNTHGFSKSKGNHQYGNLEASYEIDSLNLITLSANLFGGEFKSDNDTHTEMMSSVQETIYSYRTTGYNKSSFKNLDVNLDYQHSFKKAGEYLTLSYKFNHSPNGKEARTEYTERNNIPFSIENQYFDNDAHTSEHTAQIDYVNPINKVHYIDAGMKYIFRTNKSDSRFFLLQPDNTLWQDDQRSDFFDQGQNILAAYTDYQLKWKKLGFKAGVRYEHTFMDVDYRLTPERNFKADFDDVVPAVNLAYIISQSSSIRANYNLRINRPSIWYLNPFHDTSNPTSIKYGNPDLETEKAHILGLTYSSFTAKFSANINLNYLFTNNGIEQYSFINDGIIEETYRNAGKRQVTKLSAWLNWNPGNTTRISLNMDGSYSKLKSKQYHTENDGFNASLFANAQQSLPWDLRLSLYGGGSTPSISLQGKGVSYYFYGFNLSRSFLKEKRLNLAINGGNIFNKYQTYKSETITDTFRSWNNSKKRSWKVGLSVSWRFGDLKAKVKETVRSIHNDDVMKGGEAGETEGAKEGKAQ